MLMTTSPHSERRTMGQRQRRVRVLLSGDRWSRTFPSIKDAADYMHVSRNRIRRALDSPIGVIDRCWPPVCVDEALPEPEEEV